MCWKRDRKGERDEKKKLERLTNREKNGKKSNQSEYNNRNNGIYIHSHSFKKKRKEKADGEGDKAKL